METVLFAACDIYISLGAMKMFDRYIMYLLIGAKIITLV